MFTGIVEEIGKISQVTRGVNSQKLTIRAEKIMDDMKLGDSIAVNGICLTVTEFCNDSFTVDVMHETLNNTSLLGVSIGKRVNLERAMQLNGRFGGHIVSGHIDGVGLIADIKKDDIAFRYRISCEKHLLKYIVKKGSITIDGISLTVANLYEDSFEVSIIPHTSKNTILNEKKIGDIVNLENDCIGKYVERLINFDDNKYEAKKNSGITEEFLLKNGF
ncbi:riboflavin synthase [Peptostreptococcus porci]|uniref:riboflavin synthase n=1 Tax=Peptostreptococcus porci TaxID=2652282 RepID=UPI0023EF8B39|nr:riboflavin synthase [Peptostreptococcus porci]MDD7183558.1 riboflavin synthase [Peptostreptococcus porci]MDY4127946.1 riboflavin synthase [Peptostreptococcus porci]MDY5964246.1 riboflavin synthase [Peptostreptococcus porci]